MIYEWFLKGGFMMWPILAASVIGLGVVLDRVLAHARAVIHYPRLLQRLHETYTGRPLRELPPWLPGQRAPEARIAAIYLHYAGTDPQIRNEALQREGDRLLAEWNRHLRIIYTIAQVSPLMGLLGTVFGLVLAFYNIESMGGRVRPDDLAGGIWEALITTVAGLLVAIPAVLAYQFLLASGEKRARRMKEVISILDEITLAGSAIAGGPAGSNPPSRTGGADADAGRV